MYVVLPVQMKNFDSPTLNSTLFNDIDTCRAAIKEEREKQQLQQVGAFLKNEQPVKNVFFPDFSFLFVKLYLLQQASYCKKNMFMRKTKQNK